MERTGTRSRTKARRGRGLRFALLELARTLVDWVASFVDWARNDGDLFTRIVAWYQVISGQVVIDDQNE